MWKLPHRLVLLFLLSKNILYGHKVFFAVAWYLASLSWSYAKKQTQKKKWRGGSSKADGPYWPSSKSTPSHGCPSQHCREAGLWFPSATLTASTEFLGSPLPPAAPSPVAYHWQAILSACMTNCIASCQAACSVAPIAGWGFSLGMLFLGEEEPGASETVPFPRLLEKQILSTSPKCVSTVMVSGLSFPRGPSITKIFPSRYSQKVWEAQCHDHCPGEPVPGQCSTQPPSGEEHFPDIQSETLLLFRFLECKGLKIIRE